MSKPEASVVRCPVCGEDSMAPFGDITEEERETLIRVMVDAHADIDELE